MFIGGILIVIAAFASVYLSSKIADAKMNDYPDSGLREQPSGQEYTLPDYLNVVFKCPTLPFIGRVFAFLQSRLIGEIYWMWTHAK